MPQPLEGKGFILPPTLKHSDNVLGAPRPNYKIHTILGLSFKSLNELNSVC